MAQTHTYWEAKKDINAILLGSNTVLIGIAVRLWLFYLFTPSAPFHFGDGQLIYILDVEILKIINYSATCQIQNKFNRRKTVYVLFEYGYLNCRPNLPGTATVLICNEYQEYYRYSGKITVGNIANSIAVWLIFKAEI